MLNSWRLAASALVLAALAAVAVRAGDDVETRQIGQVVLEGVPEWDESLRDRMIQYLNTRSASVSDISPDGQTLLISTRFGTSTQLHTVSQPGGDRRQVTFYDEPVRSGAFLPGEHNPILFGMDTGGNENSQLYTLDRKTGRHTLLTDGKSRHDSSVLSPSGRWLAYSGTARNGRDFDIYLQDLSGKTPQAAKMLWQVEGAHYPVGFNKAETQLLVNKYISERETQFYAVSLAEGTVEPVTPPSPPLYYGDAAWAADDRSVYMTSDRESEFRQLYRLDLASKQWTCLTGDLNWDVDSLTVDRTSGAVIFTTNEDGYSKLYVAAADGSKRKRIETPDGVIGGLSVNQKGGRLAFMLTTPTAPGDAYVYDLASHKLEQWTRSETGGLDTDAFIAPKLIRYPTFDQVDGKPREIPAFFYPGRGEGPRPVVIIAHGGPEGQTRPSFSSTVQFWAGELGLSVIQPNVRGSTGYGRTFHQIDNGVLREDSVKDIGALLDWIAQQPELDSKRVGIYGGSYGGYMVLGSLTNFPDRFKAGIDVVGIADFVTFLKNTSEYRRDLRRAEYGDERDPEVLKVLERIAPLANAQKITARLFVLHGANDPRVPLSEAQQIVAKLRDLNRPVWFFNALNEGHGFAKKENSDLAGVLMAHFWQTELIK